jgi:hypothetical protein
MASRRKFTSADPDGSFGPKIPERDPRGNIDMYKAFDGSAALAIGKINFEYLTESM